MRPLSLEIHNPIHEAVARASILTINCLPRRSLRPECGISHISDLFSVDTCNIVHHLQAGKANSIDFLITRARHDSRGID